MKASATKFYALRVYRNNSLFDIFNTLLCNRLMKFPKLVAKSDHYYSIACKIMGKTIPNYILQNTFMRLFTAGNTLKQTDNIAGFYRKENIAIILDYCAQGSKDHNNLEVTMDNNATMFAQSAQYLVTRKNEMISIKITGLVDIPLLMKMNVAIEAIDQFWLNNSNQGKMTINQLRQGLTKLDANLTNQQFSNYLQKIHGIQQNSQNFVFDEIGFKMNQHPLYLERSKNYDHVVRLFFPLTIQQFSKAQNLIRRLEEICDPFANNENHFQILVDAEQTYVQKAIQHISEQLQQKYNKDKVYILPTIQNYLKRSVARTNYEIEIAKRKNLKFGAKLVRGAYIVQQTALAKQKNYENPIVDNFQATTYNYNTSLQAILSKVDQTGEVVVATHNQDTIATSVEIKSKYPNSPQLIYAQLLGLADHLTFQLRDKGYKVFKYLPWAKTDVMVAYMIRRAIQLQQMRYPLDIQADLLKHELKTRFFGN